MKKHFFIGYNRFVVLFWIVIGFLFSLQLLDYVPLGAAIAFSVGIFIPYYLQCSCLTNYLLPRAMAENKMKIFVAEFLIASLIMTMVAAVTSHIFSILEANGLFPESKLFNDGNLFYREVLTAYPSVILLNLAFCGLRFYHEHAKLHKTLLESQLQMLQAQVNPHYMFNVLNHIHILIRKDVDQASFLLEKYSEILRYQLYSSKKECVPLGQEIQFIKDVISIERFRWGEELSVETEWSIEDSTIMIQPLLLIAFVENAFKHVSKSITDKGYIKSIIRQRGNLLMLEVENSKSKYTEKKAASGLGLSNIKERLKILYPKKYSLNIEETDWIYKVELSITLTRTKR